MGERRGEDREGERVVHVHMSLGESVTIKSE